MKVEHYIKKSICQTPCPNKMRGYTGFESLVKKVGSFRCGECSYFEKKYIKDGKRIVECNYDTAKL